MEYVLGLYWYDLDEKLKDGGQNDKFSLKPRKNLIKTPLQDM